MFVIAVVNQKGGVGKTTVSINLAAAFARMNKSVLLVDLDQQASLTKFFTVQDVLQNTVTDLLINKIVVPTIKIGERVELIPANIDLAAAELYLPQQISKEKVLKRMLGYYKADIAIIDCPPALNVITLNGMTAADILIVPVAPEIMAERAVPRLLATAREIVENELNPTLTVWRILPTMYDMRVAHHKEMIRALFSGYKELVYPDPVKSRSKYKDMVTERKDISMLDQGLGEYWDTMATKISLDHHLTP